jgi:hypothetical protein
MGLGLLLLVEDDSTTAKVPKTVGGGIVEQDGLNESDKFEAIVPGAILPAMQAMAADLQLLLQLKHPNNFIC